MDEQSQKAIYPHQTPSGPVMIVEGMPWPLVLPLAIGMMIWGIIRAKNQLSPQPKKNKKSKKK